MTKEKAVKILNILREVDDFKNFQSLKSICTHLYCLGYEALCPRFPPFKWDEERRAQIRAELGAIFAHLYGLTRDEFAYILDTFPIIRRKDEERFGEYSTKLLCLEQYNRFEGLISHPKPLDQKLITKVISPPSQPILYEELQTMPSSEYSFSHVAEPTENSAFSNDLELIKEKIF